MFLSPNNSFDSLLKKLREIYQQNLDNKNVASDKTNNLSKQQLELNINSLSIILYNTGDITTVSSDITSDTSYNTDSKRVLSVNNTFSEIINIPKEALPFLEYENSVNPGENRDLVATAIITPDSGYTNTYIKIKGDNTVLVNGVLTTGLPTLGYFVIGTYNTYLNSIIVSADSLGSNAYTSCCKLITSGTYSGYYVVCYDTALLYPIQISQSYVSGYETYILSNFPILLGSLPYTALTLEINPDPYPILVSNYDENYVPSSPNFYLPTKSNTVPTYFRTSKSTDTNESWKINYIYNALILAKVDTINNITYNNILDTYSQTTVTIGLNTYNTYTFSTQTEQDITRPYYSASLQDVTTKTIIAIRPPLNWKENKKLNMEVS